MISLELPWSWILWAVAFVMATSSLVRLALNRRDELQAKLDTYVAEQTKAIHHKKKVLAEHRRRLALAKKLAVDNAVQEADD